MCRARHLGRTSPSMGRWAAHMARCPRSSTAPAHQQSLSQHSLPSLRRDVTRTADFRVLSERSRSSSLKPAALRGQVRRSRRFRRSFIRQQTQQVQQRWRWCRSWLLPSDVLGAPLGKYAIRRLENRPPAGLTAVAEAQSFGVHWEGCSVWTRYMSFGTKCWWKAARSRGWRRISGSPVTPFGNT